MPNCSFICKKAIPGPMGLYQKNQRMTRRNSVNWQADESMPAIRAGQGLLSRRATRTPSANHTLVTPSRYCR